MYEYLTLHPLPHMPVQRSAWVQSQVYLTVSSAKWRVQTMKAVGVTLHYGLYQWYTIATLPLSRNNLQGSKWSSDGAHLNDDTNGPWHAHLLGFLSARIFLSCQELVFFYSTQDDTCLYVFDMYLCVCVYIYTRWFKYDRDWFVCKQAALRSSCATLREW